MSLVQEAVSKAFSAEKMNVELLGNGDAHAHWHIFRYVIFQNCHKKIKKYRFTQNFVTDKNKKP